MSETLSVLNYVTSNLNTPPWNSETNYSVGSFVYGDDNREYVAIAASGPNVSSIGAKNPVSNSTFWKLVNANVSSRNVGEVFYSLIPLVDAGIHLLDGGEILGNGMYSKFVEYMASLYNDSEHRYDNLFCTATEFETSLLNYNVCGKFVYNSTTGNLRLPKVTGFIQGTVNSSAIGDLVEAGLPNITGAFGSFYVNKTGTETGAFSNFETVGSGPQSGPDYNQKGRFWDFDASRSDPTYGNSNTVQPQAIKGFVYIVLANSTKPPIEVSIDDVAADLNVKADTSLSNITKTGSAVIAHAAMPSGQYIDLALPATGGTVVAPADGFLMLVKTNNISTNQQIILLNAATGLRAKFALEGVTELSAFLPVSKNDVITVNYNATGTTNMFRFIYANGSATTNS